MKAARVVFTQWPTLPSYEREFIQLQHTHTQKDTGPSQSCTAME